MKKQFLRVSSFLIILVLIFAGCARMQNTNIQTEDNGTVFMWEVKAKEGEGKLFLLGSIHAGRDGLYPLNDVITMAYEQSDVLAVECDVSTLLQRPNLSALMAKIMYTDGTTIKDHISPELYDKTDKILKENGMTLQMLEKMKPFMVASTLLTFKMNEWGYDAENGIDMHLLNKAHDEKKTIVEIESLEFQYDLLGGFSDEIQVIQLESAVEGIESSKEYLDQMFACWEKGDVKGMESILMQEDDGLTPDQLEAYKAYEKAMFDDRNTTMTQKAEEYLSQGNTTFFVVGSGHMVGETGIVKQLRDKGYSVVQK